MTDVNNYERHNNLFFSSSKLTFLPRIELKKPIFGESKPVVFVHVSKTGGTNIDYFYIYFSAINNKTHLKAYSNCENHQTNNIIPIGCLSGVQLIRDNLSYYDLSNKPDVAAILGHMPLPTGDYFKKEVSFISVVRDPVDRLISLGNYLFQRNYIQANEIENTILNVEVDNLQTRSLAGEEFMSGPCTEETFERAIYNIKHKFAAVVPIKEVDILLSLISKHFHHENVAYSRAQVGGFSIISRENIELVEKLSERNMYDLKLYEFVKRNWQDWKNEYIATINTNTESNHNYLVISSDMYLGNDSLVFKSFAEINAMNNEQTVDVMGGQQHYY